MEAFQSDWDIRFRIHSNDPAEGKEPIVIKVTGRYPGDRDTPEMVRIIEDFARIVCAIEGLSTCIPCEGDRLISAFKEVLGQSYHFWAKGVNR